MGHFGHTYLPMSDVFYTMPITLVRFLLRYLPTPKSDVLYERSLICFLFCLFDEFECLYADHVFFCPGKGLVNSFCSSFTTVFIVINVVFLVIGDAIDSVDGAIKVELELICIAPRTTVSWITIFIFAMVEESNELCNGNAFTL